MTNDFVNLFYSSMGSGFSMVGSGGVSPGGSTACLQQREYCTMSRNYDASLGLTTYPRHSPCSPSQTPYQAQYTTNPVTSTGK